MHETIFRISALTASAACYLVLSAGTIAADRHLVLGDEPPEFRDISPQSMRADGDPGIPEQLLFGCPQTALSTSGQVSANERAPNSNFQFGRAVYLITASELLANGLPSGLIHGIGWNYHTGSGTAAPGTLVVYLQNTTNTTNMKSTTFSTAVSTMTQVHNAPTTLPAASGPFDVIFSGGAPFMYTGGGLYVAFDWSWTGPPTTTAIVYCNIALNSGLLGAQSNAAPPAILGASSFRPETWLRSDVGLANDVSVDVVYSVGSLPSGQVPPQAIQARVTNRGTSAQVNLPVTLSLTGAQTFSDTRTIASLAACGGTTTVTFMPFTAIAIGSDTVEVSIPADDNAANNTLSHPLEVTPNVYSYKYPGSAPSGGVGLSAATGQFVARFQTASATQVDSVIVEFASQSTTAYKLVIYADDGSGQPGPQIYLDAESRSVTASGSRTIRLPEPVAVGAGGFFVGIQQVNTINASFSYDSELPVRGGTFFVAAIPADGWTDLAPSGSFKLNIGIIVGECLAPLTVSVTPESVSTCEGSDVAFTCNVAGGTPQFTYQWTENGSDIKGATSSTYTANRSAGLSTYNCKVTDDGGCTAVEDATAATVTWVANGGGCQDGNPCTNEDSCAGGACQPGTNVCEDNDACTVDVCDGMGGCTHPAVDCNDSNSCTNDSCEASTGCIHAPMAGPCSDGSICTLGDACAAGVCVPGPSPAPVQFCAPGNIAINDTMAPTRASPYPASIGVTGVDDVLCSVTVSLNGLRHTFPDDIDILLAGPSAQNAIILSDVGGSIATPAAGVDLLLDDNAALPIHDSSQLASGTFKPTNVDIGASGSEEWPAPAPAPLGGSALSAFSGKIANGAWRLFVVDDEDFDSGSITGGWCLTISAAPCTLGSQCDDGIECTTDTCSGGQCVNIDQATRVTGLRIGTTCIGACTDKHTIVWDPIPGGSIYDIIYGDLQMLHSSGLNASTGGCLGDDLPGPNSDDGDTPLADQGFWYLARSRNCAGGTGTYDEGGNQQAPRDPLIPLPPLDCSTP